MRDKAFSICREFLSGSWKNINSHDMVFKSVSGGLNNILYYCSLPSTHTPLDGEPSQVLLRMYGQLHTENQPSPEESSSGCGNGQSVSTITDAVIFMMLSERNLGPKLYGVFPGGRLEEYIPARAMMCQELRDPCLSAIIARKLANVHSLDVPINKEPVWLFSTMYSWLATIQGKSPVEGKSISRDLLAFDFAKEIEWLRLYLRKVTSPVCFCHNDLQEGNILLPDLGHTTVKNRPASQTLSDDSVVLIDFEYCAYNYRAYDIANHFLEWVFDYSNPEYPFFTANYSNFPSELQRRFFVHEYLQQGKKQRHETDLQVADAEIDQVMFEVERFLLCPHLLWALWGIKNAFSSAIVFGHWEYSKQHVDDYLQHKAHVLRLDGDS